MRPRLSRRIDVGAAIEREVGDRFGVERARAVRIACRPHQHGQIVAVARIDVDAGVEQAPHHRREAERRRVDDRRLAGLVDRVRIDAMRQQHFDHAVIALEGCRRERRHVAASGQLRVGPLVEQPPHHGEAVVLGRGVERRRACEIARVDRGAFFE